MKKLLAKYRTILAVVIGLSFTILCLFYTGPVRIPVIIIWIPELLGWEIFSLLMGLLIGYIFYCWFTPDKEI